MHNTMHTSRMTYIHTYIHTFCMDATLGVHVYYAQYIIILRGQILYTMHTSSYVYSNNKSSQSTPPNCILLASLHTTRVLASMHTRVVCIVFILQQCSMHSYCSTRSVQYAHCIQSTLARIMHNIRAYTYAHTMHTTLESSMQSIMHTTQYESTNTTLEYA